MKSLKIRQEEYPQVGLSMKESFTRDQAEFSTHYKSMGAEFLSGFEAAIADIQAMHAATTGMPEQKDASARVYELQSGLYRKSLFLKDYVKAAELDAAAANEAVKALRKGDTEASVKAVRQAISIYQPHVPKLTDMPEGFAESFVSDANELEILNNEQNSAMNFRIYLTAENRAKYDAMDEYIRKVGNAGRRIFKGTPKAKEYTVSNLLSRIRAPKRAGEEAEE